MRDPFPLAPPRSVITALRTYFVDHLGFSILPLHIHEAFFSLILYTWIYASLAPRLSAYLFPKTYASFTPRTRLNWDVHVVSFLQSIIICSIVIYIIIFDPQRVDTNWADRLWGYSGIVGFCQGMAGGYFLWDLFICIRYFDIFGPGMLLHAVAALCEFSLAFRPLFHYYGPVFLLYELSSPFNNIHWFLDKLSLTGSTYQWVNGIILIASFFLCRLVWGFYFTFWLLFDLWNAWTQGLVTLSATERSTPSILDSPSAKLEFFAHADGRFMTAAGNDKGLLMPVSETVPLWMAGPIALSTVALCILNVYWIGKMVSTVRKRFPPPFGTKGQEDLDGQNKAARVEKKTR